MTKVALVTHDFAGSGGAASMTSFLYKALCASEVYHPEVISLAQSSADDTSVRLLDPGTWGRGITTQRRTHRGIDHLHVGAPFCELEPFRYRPRALLDDVLSEFDLVQFVTGTPPWAYAACNVQQPVFLWTATTVWEDRATRMKDENGPRAWWQRAMTQGAQSYERKALRESDRVFALSDYTRENLSTQFSVDATLATQGIDDERFHPVEQPREEYILTVSRINDPRKRIVLLLEAYAEAIRENDDVPDLYLVGDAPNQRIRRAVRDLGVGERVRFLGRQSQDELVELYQHALCFVLSSDEEGLGIVILEAMACGRPVVSTRSGGPATLIKNEETGLLTPLGDVRALKRGIQRLADDPSLRARMGEAGRRRVEEKFSNAVAQEAFLEVYDRYRG